MQLLFFLFFFCLAAVVGVGKNLVVPVEEADEERPRWCVTSALTAEHGVAQLETERRGWREPHATKAD